MSNHEPEDELSYDPKRFFCDMCDVKMNGQATWDLHVAGKKHMRALKYKARNQNEERPWDRMGKYFCSLCRTHLQSEITWQSHLEGKKHLKAVAISKGDDRDADSNASNVKFYCEQCEMKFASMTTYEAHLIGKRHKKKTQDSEMSSRSINVTGIPPKMENKRKALSDHFSQFGDLQELIYIPQLASAKVRYWNEESRNNALERVNHVVMGCAVGVAPLESYTRDINQLTLKNRMNEFKKVEEATFVANAILKERTVDAQIKKMMSLTEMEQSEREKRKRFVQELQDVLRRFLPELALTVYGSSHTFFGSKYSDVDIHMDIDRRLTRHRVDQLPPLALPDMSAFPTLKEELGYVGLESYMNASVVERLNFIAAALKVSPILPVIRDLRLLPGAKVPLIKFWHFTSNFGVDISFGNSLAVQNTRLQMLFCLIDERFKTLVMTIRYWAQHVGVAADVWTNSVSKYSLVLLVYFYLENTEPPVLPTTQGLMDISTSDEDNIIDGWACTYSRNIKDIRQFLIPDRNQQSIAELLRGFFIFYANIDLFNVVICPRTGKIVNVLTFKEKIKNDPQMKNMVCKDITLQDPLELSHNTLDHVRPSATRTRFSEEIIKAAVAVSNTPDWTLRNILVDPKPYKPDHQEDERRGILFPFQLSFLPTLFANFGGIPEIEAQWHQWIVELTLRVLGVFQMHYEIVSEYDPDKVLFSDIEIPGAESRDICPDVEETNEEKETEAEEVPENTPGTEQPEQSKTVYKEVSAYGQTTCVSLDSDENMKDDSTPSTSQGDEAPTGTKRRIQDATNMMHRKKTRRPNDFSQKEVHKHESLIFNLEKIQKEVTIIQCCSIHNAWQRHPRTVQQLNMHREDFSSLFSFEEALTEAVLNLLPADQKYLKYPAQFVLKIERFSYGHNTYIEIHVFGHRRKISNANFDNMVRHLNNLIGSELHASY